MITALVRLAIATFTYFSVATPVIEAAILSQDVTVNNAGVTLATTQDSDATKKVRPIRGAQEGS